MARQLPDEVRLALPLDGVTARGRALREAALLGVGLLRGEERAAEIGSFGGRMESET